MADRRTEPVVTDEEVDQESRFNSGNLLFAFLGAWSACIVCLLVYAVDPSDSDTDRAPAQEAPKEIQQPKNPEPFYPEAYLLSFNSIHFEK